jgi:epsilon-lactone hydrolase
MGSSPSLTAGQRATISSQAAEFISKLRHPPFADSLAPFLVSLSRIPSIRANLKEKMLPGEENLISKYSLQIAEILISNLTVITISPSRAKPEHQDKILLNICGGAFVMGSARDRTALLMAAEMGIRVYSIEYSKSPESRYPVARDECLSVYRQLVKEHDANNILCMSSSAGSQLMLSMLILAHEEGLPMPKGQLLCTPATDLTGDGDSMVANAGRDLMPISFLMEMVKQNYAPKGDFDAKDPLYSPIFAEYGPWFPPSVVTVGTRDCMLSSGVRLYWKLRESGCRVQLLVEEGMWHGFNWEEGIPEADRMRAAVRQFLEEV